MMNARPSNSEPLCLVRIAGPDIPPIQIQPDTSARLGRALDCEFCLSDPTVSRQHCTISGRHDRWFITDLGSRAGTLLNAVPLPANAASPLESGDLISLGPWLLRVSIGMQGPVSMYTIDDAAAPATYLETIHEGQLAGMAQQRLSLLLDYASELNKAANESELAHSVLRCAVAGSGITRAALVRPIDRGDEVEVVASLNADNQSGQAFTISRSLVREAAAGRVARLNTRVVADVAVSIADLGIHSALAAPIHIDTTVVACLYMDARGGESRVRSDAADFCIALARLCGLAFANIKRDQLEERRRELESELSAAREAQQLIIPSSGTISGLSCRLAMQPGSFVAGDLFDAFTMDDGRIAVSIGDVTGHGVGAGILMAATQAYLNAALRHFADPARAIAATSAYLASHAAPNRFVSLWVGLFDPVHRTLTYVDAGHGHWMLIDPIAGSRVVESAGGPPLGIDPDFVYPSEVIPFDKGAAILLYSDGIIEQCSPMGEQFGRHRLHEALKLSSGQHPDPAAILDAVIRYAATKNLDDDATAAIITWDS